MARIRFASIREGYFRRKTIWEIMLAVTPRETARFFCFRW